MRRWVIMSGKGEAFVTSARSAYHAVTLFNARYKSTEVASVYEATEF